MSENPEGVASVSHDERIFSEGHRSEQTVVEEVLIEESSTVEIMFKLKHIMLDTNDIANSQAGLLIDGTVSLNSYDCTLIWGK